jgi:hypothetical protein
MKDQILTDHAEAADFYVGNNYYNESYEEQQRLFITRFAELIVFECVNAVMDGTKEGDHYAQRIEQHFDNGPGGILHFGIEE